jgi:hypothetical protein
MNASTPKLAIQARQTPNLEKINKTVTKKLYHKQKPQPSFSAQMLPSCLSTVVSTFNSMLMIIPAILVGIMAGIGAAFEVGMEKAM